MGLEELDTESFWTALEGYADDLFLLASSAHQACIMAHELIAALANIGLALSIHKMMWIASEVITDTDIIISGKTLVKSSDLDVLGAVLSSDGSSAAALAARLSKMWKSFHDLKHLLLRRSASVEKRLHLLHLAIIPVLTWGPPIRG